MTAVHFCLGILFFGVAAAFLLIGRVNRRVRDLRGALADLRSTHEGLARENELKLRSLAALAIGQVQPDKAVDRLLLALAHKDSDISAAAAALLVRAGSGALEPVARSAGQRGVSASRAIAVINELVVDEGAILKAAMAGVQSDEFCKALLTHDKAGTALFDWVAANASSSTLSCLVTVERAQGTTAQVTAQKRLREEAERLREKEEEEQRAAAADEAGDWRGPCFCRWQ